MKKGEILEPGALAGVSVSRKLITKEMALEDQPLIKEELIGTVRVNESEET